MTKTLKTNIKTIKNKQQKNLQTKITKTIQKITKTINKYENNKTKTETQYKTLNKPYTKKQKL